MPLGAVLAGIGQVAGPIAGSIGAAALQRKWALQDWNRVNAYNHPKEQVRRNAEAGLPLAAMFSGSGGSTSSDVGSSNVDPTLGSAQGINNYMQHQMQKKQRELIDAQIYTEQGRGQTAWKEAALKANELTRDLDRLQYDINAEGKDTVAPGYMPPSNQVQGMVRERQMQEARLFVERNINHFKQIDFNLRKAKNEADIALVGAQLNNMCLDAGIKQQIINERNVVQVLIQQMQKDGISAAEAFGHMLLTGGFQTNILNK